MPKGIKGFQKGNIPWYIKKKLPHPNLGRRCSEETKKKLRLTNKGQNPWNKGKKNIYSKNALKKMSETRKRLFKEGKIIHPMLGKKLPKHSERMKKHNPMRIKKYREKALKNRLKVLVKHPNKTEQLLNQILQENFPNEFKFVGDGSVVFDRFCPDFINCNGKKLIIEMFGDYWHRNDNPQDRINHFAKYGFNTLIIWEHELNDKEKVIKKIQEFLW